MKRIKPTRVLKLLLFGYGLFCLGCAVFQRRMIYSPPISSPAQVDESARSQNLERWFNASGQPIGLKRLSPKQPATGQVLMVYGNGSCATGTARYADQFQPVADFDVFILEYPGYADRPGSPSQNSFFRAADEAFRLMPTNHPTYVLGESLGTGVAAHLAGTFTNQIAGLVLFAPYNRLTDVAQYHMPLIPVHLLLIDRFPSQDYLRAYHGPVGILVAGQDTVVPEKFGRRLYDSYQGPKQLWEFPSENHGTVRERDPAFWKQVIAFWKANPN